MEILRRQVAEVRRRLFIGRLAAAWPWCGTTLLGAAAVWIAVDRYVPLGAAWYFVVAGAGALSLIAIGAWAWLKRPDEFHAALELDRRCGLQERVSSTWALRQSADAMSPAVEAVGADAAAALAKVDVAASFAIAPSRRWAWPIAPFTAAIALALLPRPETDANTGPQISTADRTAAADIRKAVAALEKALEQQRTEAEKLKLAEAQRLLESLQQQARQMASDTSDRKEALVKMNDLIAQAEERRQTTDAAEEIKKQVSRLKSKRPGPAEQLASALGRGDFQDAAEEAERLGKESTEKLDAAQQEQLSQQLADLQDEVGAEARLQQAEREQLQQRADNSDEGSDAARQLAQAVEVANRLGGLQRAIDAAAKAANQGDAEATRKALDELRNQLAKLDREGQENRLMEAGAKALVECKGGIAGGADGGKSGAGGGAAALLTTKAGGQSSNLPGGLAPGTSTSDPTANGEKPLGESAGTFVDRRVPQTVGTGGFRVVGATGGPNTKGQMLEAIREQAAAIAERGESQTLENQPLERARRDQRQQYFDALRKPE